MKDLQWRPILIRAGILGLLGGVVPIFFGANLLISATPIAMMFAIYLTVPKAQGNRTLVGMIASVLVALLSLAIFFAYQYLTVDAAEATELFQYVLYQTGLSILILSFFGSFVFAKVTSWTEKKRLEFEAKMDAKKEAQKKQYANRPKRKVKKKKKR